MEHIDESAYYEVLKPKNQEPVRKHPKSYHIRELLYVWILLHAIVANLGLWVDLAIIIRDFKNDLGILKSDAS